MEIEKSLLLGLTGLTAAKFGFLLSIYNKVPKHAEYVGTVGEIMLYPVKSCRGIPIKEGVCSYKGVRSVDWQINITDRHFLVCKAEDGVMMTMKVESKMATILTSIHGTMLHLDAPGMDTLIVPLEQNSTVVKDCMVGLDYFQGTDCGDEAAQWLSKFIGQPLRLLYADNKSKKRDLTKVNKPKWKGYARAHDKVGFSDFAPYLITVDRSLEDLNSRIPKPITHENFRPNLVIHTDGKGKPFDEDTWDSIYIGENAAKLCQVKPCDRCPLITIDPETGIKDAGEEPLKTLREYRLYKRAGVQPFFGMHVGTDIEGQIKIGDPVYVTRRPTILY